MATNITIPQTTLQVGVNTFGPQTMNHENNAVLTIDRTVAGGLNSLTSATTLLLAIQTSTDGVNWDGQASMGPTVGGILTDRHGQVNTNQLMVRGMGGAGVQVEVVATVGGPSPVVVDGSIVLS